MTRHKTLAEEFAEIAETVNHNRKDKCLAYCTELFHEDLKPQLKDAARRGDRDFVYFDPIRLDSTDRMETLGDILEMFGFTYYYDNSGNLSIKW